ncbi:Intracellular distribution of mitochondria [Lithohypha guttulata]|uniref:Intracellular distribution of mitochondria n=1 Tax=Lithohypha guttulata TaxID=1690604 RepID=UPI002DDE1268|nr:Intracellular distribution of mitochondria [Lithohypha guttulata]KAK5106720.1 Intracellular distribution of mitochondria [Lithohypha guttulata]
MAAPNGDISEKQLPNGADEHEQHEHGSDHHHEHEHEHDHDHENPAITFQVHVKLPHKPHKLTLTVSNQEQVQDLRQSIVETPDTFQYTCFHLEHNGERINDFVELSEVKDLGADSEVTLVEDPYTEKEARMHVVRMRELIGAAGDRSDQLHGICAGASLHDDLFGAAPASEAAKEKVADTQGSLAGYDVDSKPDINTILPKDQNTLPKTVKGLSVSQWNPPPHHLRQRGHLLYLVLATNEGEQHQITASISGFSVNKSSSNKFDPFPRPAPKNYSAHSLLGLISLLSPSFNASFVELQKANGQKDLLTTFPFQNAIPANPWLLNPSAAQHHQSDPTRSQEAFLLGGADGAENLRDWNEEFQTTRELPRETLQDRVFRERLTSKLFADYNDAAARGAVLVARGEVAPLNPTEGKDAQIFIYNNIFYSFGADGVQTFASEGGDEAARVAVGKDVTGVKAVNQLDIPDLFTPGTVVVDYLGKRIVGQSIVPGIFKQREPGEHQIDYGGVEGRDVVTENAAFVPVFEKLSKALHVKKHAVWDKEGKRHDLEGSVETKGLLGTDGRKYVLDLYRIAPLDVAWQEQVAAEEQDNKYPHRMSIIRSELVEAYWRTKMQEYVKAEVEKKKAAQPDQKQIEGEEKIDEKSEEKKEGDTESKPAEQERVDLSKFDWTINPDVCSGQVPQTDEEKEEYLQDEQEVRAVCSFLREKVIPELIHDLYETDVGFPMDGVALTQLLHKRGINVRYLGLLTKSAEEKGQRIKAFATVALQEMVARAFKHIINGYLRHLPAIFAPNAIAHLLNCLLGREVNAAPGAELGEEQSFYSDGDYSFQKVTPDQLAKDIELQVRMRYRYDLPGEWQMSIKPLQLLREICLKNGIQLAARDFALTKTDLQERPALNGTAVNGVHHEENKKKKAKKARGRSESPDSETKEKPQTTFVPDDILNVTPIVKDASPKSALAEEALEAGKISLAQGQKQLGQELVLESLSLHEQIYGILHPEVAKMYHSLSTIYYQIEEKEAAVELARKAVIVTERTLGVDSHDTILAYLNLSLFEHHVGNTKRALKYVRHALDVWNVIYGSHHPDSITTMNNAAVMFQSLKEYAESRRWFEACFKVCEEFYGKQSINAATILFQLAQALALDGDAKGAVNKMREAYSVFKEELGAEDRNTKEAETWLEQLTQNAVNLAKQAQYLEKRGIKYMQMPRLPGATRLQPQNATTAAPKAATNNGTTTSATSSTTTNPTANGADMRSIDELLRFIEGGDMASPKGKSKRKSMNPKARGRKSAA